MKRVVKIVAGVVLVLISICVVFFLIQNFKPAAPSNYQRTVKTGGEIEAAYMKDGPYQVSKHEQRALQSFGKFIVYYPSALASSGRKWPVIVLCNGSGTPLSKYAAVAKHYASWGFIVIGTEEKYSWNGFGAEMCVRYLELVNEQERIDDADNIFRGTIDFDHVGIAGHSQGGVGVINAVTDTDHKDVYKTAVALSPTNQTLADQLMWHYDASEVHVPILLISGAGGGDDWVVTGEQLKAIYDVIPSDKVAMRRKDTAHSQVLYAPDGYVTAWFMWQLQDDGRAAKAFTGAHPEILTNKHYQDQQISIAAE
ncbi:MAG: hypothetical protein ACI4W2_08190 [Eubacterium sp.]